MTTSPLADRDVLIVEDEFLIADDLARSLRQVGASVLGPGPSREDAAKLMAAGSLPHVAVLDLNLQGDAVFPLADDLAARGVPVLFLSGYDRPHLPERFADAPLLQKPHEMGRLVRCLARLLTAGGN